MAYFKTIVPPSLKFEDVFPTPEYRIVAAIDLGTKFSGYAFQFVGHKEVIVNTNWAESSVQYKAPTCLLLDSEGKCVSFGQEAIMLFTEMDYEEARDHYCFSFFKMFLYDAMKNKNKLDRTTPLKDMNGKEYPAIKVFGECLKFLKRHMVDSIKKSSGSDVTGSDVLWVLTVPAIWDDVAKDFMREAAYEGELIDRSDPDRLMIALEPEVAALYCRTVPISSLATGGEIREAEQGEQYLVVDAGGGTVDITAHEVLMGGEVKEIIKATGGPHGGGEVDRNFINLLGEIFSEEFLDVFQKTNGTAMQEIYQNLESAKRRTDFTGKRMFNIDVPREFFDKFEEEVGETVQDMLDSFQENRGSKIVRRRGQALGIPLPDAQKLFAPVCEKIKEISIKLMKQPEMASCKTVFLVGGFADSSLLQETMRTAMKDEFPDARVIIPNEAGLAVLRGAVTFGKAPMMIKERIMQRSYGVPVVLPWDDNRYKNTAKKIEHSGRSFCRDVFYPFVYVGDTVRVGDHKEHVFSPLNQDSSVFTATICSSPNRDVTYSDEAGCQEVGEVSINLPPMPVVTAERPCGLYFYFGGTEVRVIAMDIRTQTKAETKISFMSKPADDS